MTESKTKRLKMSLAFHTSALEKLQAAYLAISDGGVKSYTIGPRSLTKLDLPEIEAEISKHEAAIDSIESQLNGGGKRKALAIVRVDNI